PFGREQRKLLHLLVRGEQVSLDAVGEELERLARSALALAREPLGDPGGKTCTLDRPYVHHHAGARQGTEPGAPLAHAGQARQRDEEKDVGAGTLAVLRDGLAALDAGLAAGQAQLHDLLSAEERQARERVRELAPVEAPAGLEYLAVGEAARAGRRAHRVR